MSAGSAASVDRPPRGRSAVTNGSRWFVDGDGNSAWSRRYRDLVHEHAADLGGIDSLTQAQLSLVRRVSTLQLELEQQEGRASMGEPLDVTAYTTAVNCLKRIHEVLGIERKPRNDLDLAGFIAAQRAAAEAEAQAAEASK